MALLAEWPALWMPRKVKMLIRSKSVGGAATVLTALGLAGGLAVGAEVIAVGVIHANHLHLDGRHA